MKGTLPLIPKTEKFPRRVSPKRKARKLKKVRSRNALKISGDLVDELCPFLEKDLLLLYKGNNDWIIPVTQKKLMKLAIKRNTSYRPISSVDRWLFVKRILIRRKVLNLISWNICSPEILFIKFSCFKVATSSIMFFYYSSAAKGITWYILWTGKDNPNLIYSLTKMNFLF